MKVIIPRYSALARHTCAELMKCCLHMWTGLDGGQLETMWTEGCRDRCTYSCSISQKLSHLFGRVIFIYVARFLDFSLYKKQILVYYSHAWITLFYMAQCFLKSMKNTCPAMYIVHVYSLVWKKAVGIATYIQLYLSEGTKKIPPFLAVYIPYIIYTW